MPGAFKLDHLQPIELIFSKKIFNFFIFILGGQFLLPQIFQPQNSIYITSKNVTFVTKEKGKTQGSGVNVSVGVGSVVHLSICLVWPATKLSDKATTRIILHLDITMLTEGL